MTTQVIDLFAGRDLFGARTTRAQPKKPNRPKKPNQDAKKGYASVLLVGGPLGGQRRTLPPSATAYRVVYKYPDLSRRTGLYELAVEGPDGGEFHFSGFSEMENV